MATDVIMPKIAESIFEGTLTKWLKKEGERVERDEPLFEISTDKVDTEIPSPESGVVTEILVQEGETVEINTIVCRIDPSGKAGPLPERPAPPSEKPKEPSAAPREEKRPAKPREESGGDKRRVLASPLVKKMAEREGVDLRQIRGTGFKGRITKQDLLNFMQRKGAEAAKPEGADQEERVAPPPTRLETRQIQVPPGGDGTAIPHVITGPTESVKMTPMRKKIADHMVLSRRISPHVHTLWEADLSKVLSLREREKDYFERVYGTRLTLTAFFSMAAVQALKEFPLLNASVEGEHIVYHRYVNLGIAVALPEGLIVPVIRNADEMSFRRLCTAINDVVDRARSKKLKIEDVQGGTFTITNPGGFGGLIGFPIINQPQVAILGVGGVQKRPVAIGDAVAVRPMIYLSLSFDHRIIDGAVADHFMGHIRSTLEGWDLPVK